MGTSLEGRIALVTGASSGIGEATALALSAAGAKVALAARRRERLDALAARIRDSGGEALVIVADLAREDEAQRAVRETEAHFGQLDILVNNAGVTRDNLAMRMKDEEWEQVIRINLEAAFRLMRAAVRPMMKARFGRIVTVTSVVGATGNPGQVNYAAAKAGLVGMTKSLAQEVASRGITANCEAPGFIRTPMTDVLPDAQKEALNGRIPMGRMGSGEDVGAAVAYLASREAEYVTGQTLHVNGGMAMFA
jgi:3-oxoacyl-[acyl-carrier protein] reductase